MLLNLENTLVKIKYKLNFKRSPTQGVRGLFRLWTSGRQILFRGPSGYAGSIDPKLKFLIEFLRWSDDPEKPLFEGLSQESTIIRAYCAEGLFRLGILIPSEIVDRFKDVEISWADIAPGKSSLRQIIHKNNQSICAIPKPDLISKSWSFFKKHIDSENVGHIMIGYQMGADILIVRNGLSLSAYAYDVQKEDIVQLAMDYEHNFKLPYPSGRSIHEIATERNDLKMLSKIKKLHRGII